jgi:hypothetical protein
MLDLQGSEELGVFLHVNMPGYQVSTALVNSLNEPIQIRSWFRFDPDFRPRAVSHFQQDGVADAPAQSNYICNIETKQ